MALRRMNWTPWATQKIQPLQSSPAGSLAGRLMTSFGGQGDLQSGGATLPSYQPQQQASYTTPNYTPYSPQLGSTGPAPTYAAASQPAAQPAAPPPTQPAAPTLAPANTTFGQSQRMMGQPGNQPIIPTSYNLPASTYQLSPQAQTRTQDYLQQYARRMNTPTGPQPEWGHQAPLPTGSAPAAPVVVGSGPMNQGESALQYALRMGLNPNQASAMLSSMMTGNG